jgi:1-acyl-sn-glycerol-3-phosphate acyltransferase
MRAAISELQSGRCVLIYPEGTRTPDGTVKLFKSGVALLLKRADAMVIPIGIDGAFDAWPRNRSRPRWRRAIECEAGEPIPSAELLADGVPAAMKRLEKEVEVLRLRCRARLRARFGPEYPAAGPGDQSRSESAP